MEQLITEIMHQDDVRSSLSEMRKEIKEMPQRNDWQIEDVFIERLQELLSHEDAKTRKNAALLLGDLAEKTVLQQSTKVLEELLRAFEGETTKFVQSSYIQAMNSFDCAEVLERLQKRYEALLAEEPLPEEVKHNRELRKALERILSTQGRKETLVFQGLRRKHIISLEAESYIRELLAQRIQQETRLQPKVTASGVRVTTDNLDVLLKEPLYRELLFVIRQKAGMEMTREHLAEGIVTSELLPLLEEVFASKGPFAFRLTCGKGKDTWDSKQMRELVYAIEEQSNHRLRNSTDRYVVDVEVRPKKDGTYNLYARIPSCMKERFEYLAHRLPTSMSPVLAAQMVALVKPYLREGAHIIDPFCGVGTLLVERCKSVAARDIYGVDSYGEAIAFARENTQKAGKEFYYINRDYFDFTSSHLLDEVITEFPRMENKEREQVDIFYRKFFDKTSEITREDAVLLLLSTEENALKKQLRLHDEFQMLRQIPMRGQENIYIIKKRG